MNEKFTPGKWEPNFATGLIGTPKAKYAIGAACQSAVSPEEYEANLRLMAHAKDLYHVAVMARVFVPRNSQNRTDIENLLREINPDFDKRPEVMDIKEFAKRVKNMWDWQKQRANNPDDDTERYVAGNEQLVDSIVAEILEEADNGK